MPLSSLKPDSGRVVKVLALLSSVTMNRWCDTFLCCRCRAASLTQSSCFGGLLREHWQRRRFINVLLFTTCVFALVALAYLIINKTKLLSETKSLHRRFSLVVQWRQSTFCDRLVGDGTASIAVGNTIRLSQKKRRPGSDTLIIRV